MADLTRDAILAMPAGPEMDALVAERVLGKVECDAWTLQRLTELGPMYIRLTQCGHEACRPRGFVPSYSTDIAAAWAVVEHLRARRFTASVDLDLDDPRGDAFAYFRGEAPNRHGCDPEGSARADTAALAICRAALVATLEERTDG